MKFKFKAQGPKEPVCSPHVIGNTTYKPGDIIETDSDLAKRFPQKFERVSDTANAMSSAPSQEPVRTPLPLSDFGDNVSTTFDDVPAGYAVFFDKIVKHTLIDLVGQTIVRFGLRTEDDVREALMQLNHVLGNAEMDA